MNDAPLPAPYARDCWCGDYRQFAWSHEFNVCRVCGTLVTRAKLAPEALKVTADSGELYSKDYWLRRQGDNYGLPAIEARARLDLPERCAYWLRTLLRYKLPNPNTRTLELGCAHGGFVALMKWAGFTATGIEMSPWVVDFARQTFGVEVLSGPLETQTQWAPATFDAILLHDVMEHLPDPLGTLGRAATLLKPDGVIFIQTPEYKEHLSYNELVVLGEDYTRPMAGKNEEHLFLYSRRSTQEFWQRLGFPYLNYRPALFPYDMYYSVSREPLVEHEDQVTTAALEATPTGRLVEALLARAAEADGCRAEIARLKST